VNVSEQAIFYEVRRRDCGGEHRQALQLSLIVAANIIPGAVEDRRLHAGPARRLCGDWYLSGAAAHERGDRGVVRVAHAETLERSDERRLGLPPHLARGGRAKIKGERLAFGL